MFGVRSSHHRPMMKKTQMSIEDGLEDVRLHAANLTATLRRVASGNITMAELIAELHSLDKAPVD